jgi:hypothetical protein
MRIVVESGRVVLAAIVYQKKSLTYSSAGTVSSTPLEEIVMLSFR